MKTFDAHEWHRSLLSRACRYAGVLACAALLLGMDTPAYRFRRPIEASAGWNVLRLPPDVIAAARPELADIRIVASSGEEVPFVRGTDIPQLPARFPLSNVERGNETTAELDRGANPTPATGATLDIEEDEFIKPVTLEASDDRTTWREVARTAIFATSSGVRMTALRFAPNDRRHWRFRFDDQRGAPLTPTHVTVRFSERTPACTLVPGAAKIETAADETVSTYSVTLPYARAQVSEVRVRAGDPAYKRRARVFERVWFRDEVSRRLLGSGEISSDGHTERRETVPAAAPTGAAIEVDIDRTSVPLHEVSFQLCVESPALFFHLPVGVHADLVYGRATAAPAYDLAAALAAGLPSKIGTATLGTVVDTGAEEPPLPPIERGPALATRGFKTERPMTLPAQGPVAYLDLEPLLLDNMRIVDKQGRQVPYLVESELRHVRVDVDLGDPTPASSPVHLRGLDQLRGLSALELDVASPAFFSRDAVVFEETFDARGRTGERHLGSAKLLRTPDGKETSLRIPLTAPAGSAAIVRITDADNAPLRLSALSGDCVRRRIDFVFEPGDELRLLTVNPNMEAPAYDLSLVAHRVLESPASAAILGAAQDIVVTRAATPAWFWIFVVAAGVILLFALARTLLQPVAK